mmetsp:Transcript_74810/g.136713  ORF Transcript_74810/g.136713 Transcript_74810/m.136713 type:complete len:607 (-) Transcript_74810:95-1915(-)
MSKMYTVSICLLACIIIPRASAGEVCNNAEDLELRNKAEDLQLRDSLKFVTEMELKAAEEEESAVMQVQLLQTSQMKKRGERLSPASSSPASNSGQTLSAMQTEASHNTDSLAVEVEERPWGEAEKTDEPAAADVARPRHDDQEKGEAPSFLQVGLDEEARSNDRQAAVPSPVQDHAEPAPAEKHRSDRSAVAPAPLKKHAEEIAPVEDDAAVRPRVQDHAHRKRHRVEGPGKQLLHGAIMLVFLLFMVYLLKVFTRVPEDWLGVKAGPPAGQGPAPVEKGAVRAHVEAFDICSATDVGDLLPVASSYDCIFQKPVMSGKALRLEARIEGLSDGGTLLAPLTQRSCVLYSAVARCNKGPTPVKSSKAPNFVVSLIGSPLMQIEVEGQDVSLFDMCGGKWTCSQPLLEAAPHLQDFVVTHTGMDPENECETSSSLRALGPGVEFEECALLVGSTVTIVGELYRAPSGSLSFRPWRESALDELTDTIKPSWENHGCKVATPLCDEEVLMSSDEIMPGKLLLSDHPGLLGSVVPAEKPKPECTEECKEECKEDHSSCRPWEMKLARLNRFFHAFEWVVRSSKNAGGDAAQCDVWAAMWGNADSCTYLSV